MTSTEASHLPVPHRKSETEGLAPGAEGHEPVLVTEKLDPSKLAMREPWRALDQGSHRLGRAPPGGSCCPLPAASHSRPKPPPNSDSGEVRVGASLLMAARQGGVGGARGAQEAWRGQWAGAGTSGRCNTPTPTSGFCTLVFQLRHLGGP